MVVREDARSAPRSASRWCTDRLSGVSDGHRVFVLHAVKLETKDVSQRERYIRALCGRVSEKEEVMCFVVSCTRVA